MKSHRHLTGLIGKAIVGLIAISAASYGAGALAQNSAPPPGSGGAFTPSQPGPGPGPGPGGACGPGPGGMCGPGPAPLMPSNWGNPWASSWANNQTGVTNVIGCGYDAQGVWRTIPMRVSYTYNGVQYNCTVLSAWNPWTDMWNRGIDQPAFNTSYYINGSTFNYYTVLSTGTYYFNL